MRGYYVIWSQDTEMFTSRREAIRRGKEIFSDGLDYEVFVQRFDDNNDDGYFACEETTFISDIM